MLDRGDVTVDESEVFYKLLKSHIEEKKRKKKKKKYIYIYKYVV